MPRITPFGKAVKKKLVDMEQRQEWLIECVKAETGLYFDGSYLHKIITGQLRTPKIMQAICTILSIQTDDEIT